MTRNRSYPIFADDVHQTVQTLIDLQWTDVESSDEDVVRHARATLRFLSLPVATQAEIVRSMERDYDRETVESWSEALTLLRVCISLPPSEAAGFARGLEAVLSHDTHEAAEGMRALVWMRLRKNEGAA